MALLSSGNLATLLGTGLARDAAGVALGDVRKLLALFLASNADFANGLCEGGYVARIDGSQGVQRAARGHELIS